MSADYTKLEGKGNTGDFVLKSQGGAVAEGFPNVSQYWYVKTHDYDYGFEMMEKDRQSRDDIICPAHSMMPIVDADGKFAFAYDDGREFKLDDWAATQYAAKMGIPVSVFNWLNEDTTVNGKVRVKRDDKDSRLLTLCVANALRRVPKDKKFRFRTYNNNTIRAVLSEDYVIVDNRWYLEVLKECIPGGRLSHWRGDADTFYGNILIPHSIRAEADSEYGGMVSAGNCEVGKRRLSQFPSVFRAICMNGCVWDQTKGKNIRQVHRGKEIADAGVLRKMIAENIQYQIPLVSKGIDRILNTQKYKVDKISSFIAEVGISFNLHPTELMEVANQYKRHESAHRNLFGVVNALTRAGQEFDNKRWVDFDNYAGELIAATPESFARMNARAENLSDEYVAEAFGVKG